jgi:hypothetical protein
VAPVTIDDQKRRRYRIGMTVDLVVPARPTPSGRATPVLARSVAEAMSGRYSGRASLAPGDRGLSVSADAVTVTTMQTEGASPPTACCGRQSPMPSASANTFATACAPAAVGWIPSDWKRPATGIASRVGPLKRLRGDDERTNGHSLAAGGLGDGDAEGAAVLVGGFGRRGRAGRRRLRGRRGGASRGLRQSTRTTRASGPARRRSPPASGRGPCRRSVRPPGSEPCGQPLRSTRLGRSRQAETSFMAPARSRMPIPMLASEARPSGALGGAVFRVGL